MVNKYHLVNPHIDGDFESTANAKNSNEAANKLYSKLSEHFNNSVPVFYFTIQKGGGKYYHFQVKEQRSENEVNFSIKSYNVEDESAIQEFETKLENYKNKRQAGGKKSKKSKKAKKPSSSDDELDSSSSSDYYINSKSNPLSQPFYYWWYDPYVYKIDSVYIPTFYSYVTPLFELAVLPVMKMPF